MTNHNSDDLYIVTSYFRTLQQYLKRNRKGIETHYPYIYICYFLEIAEKDDCQTEEEIRQKAIDKLFEDSKAHLQEWERMEQIWEETLTRGSKSAARLAKFVSDEAEGGNDEYIIVLFFYK